MLAYITNDELKCKAHNKFKAVPQAMLKGRNTGECYQDATKSLPKC